MSSSLTGLTLAPVAYILYRGVLSALVTVKLDDMEVIDDKQYGFSNIQLSKFDWNIINTWEISHFWITLTHDVHFCTS
jgi:hypothetical protein